MSGLARWLTPGKSTCRSTFFIAPVGADFGLALDPYSRDEGSIQVGKQSNLGPDCTNTTGPDLGWFYSYGRVLWKTSGYRLLQFYHALCSVSCQEINSREKQKHC